MSLLAVRHLTKYFLPPRSLLQQFRFPLHRVKPMRALDDVSFSIKQASLAGIIGPNGAGKTTLLKIIATLMLPDSGTVSIKNYSPPADEMKIKSLVGLATGDERSLYWRLTGRQNLELFAHLHGLPRQKIASRISELLAYFRIEYADKRFDTYSSGMKRKIEFVKALVHDPEIVLLDEPTKSLDQTSSDEMHSFLQNIVSLGKTVLLATHNIAEAEQLSQIMIVLYQGRLLGFGTPQELAARSGAGHSSVFAAYRQLIKNAEQDTSLS